MGEGGGRKKDISGNPQVNLPQKKNHDTGEVLGVVTPKRPRAIRIIRNSRRITYATPTQRGKLNRKYNVREKKTKNRPHYMVVSGGSKLLPR